MMTSSNGNIFRVTGPLWGGEFRSQRPVTRNFDVFFNLRLNKRLNKDVDDLRRHRAHYDVTVMSATPPNLYNTAVTSATHHSSQQLTINSLPLQGRATANQLLIALDTVYLSLPTALFQFMMLTKISRPLTSFHNKILIQKSLICNTITVFFLGKSFFSSE